jgi:hypothetical protein
MRFAVDISPKVPASLPSNRRDYAIDESPYLFDTEGILLCRSLLAHRVKFSNPSYPEIFILKSAIRHVGTCRLRPAMELRSFTLHGCV